MDFVETKYYSKIHFSELNLKIENMSRNRAQKPKNCRLNHMHIQNAVTLEKYLKLFLKNLTQKLNDFEAIYVEKVPKCSVFNQECLENSNHHNSKIMKIKNGSNKKIVFSRPIEKYVLGK